MKTTLATPVWLRLRTRLAGTALLLCLAGGSAHAAVRPWRSYLYGGDCNAVAGRGSEAWVATSAGIRVYSTTGAKVEPLGPEDDLPGPVITALTFADRALWAAAAGGTVGRLDPETNTWVHYAESARFPAADASKLIWDGTDVWAATLGAGVARFSPMRKEWRVWDTADGLPSKNVLALAADAQSVWAGTDRGLARFDRQTEAWDPLAQGETPPAALAGPIVDLLATTKYVWLAATDGGLVRLERQSGQLGAYNSLEREYGMKRVDRLLLTGDGSLWVAGDSGLLRAEQEGAGRWTFFKRGPWDVTGLASAGGSLWVTTRRSGVQEYRAATNDWQVYQAQEPLPSGDITALAAGPEAGWVGFLRDGLARFDVATERWEALAPREGRPKLVRDIAVQGRFVYLAGADGLALYDSREHVWQTAFVENVAELRGDDWTSVVADDRAVFLAGMDRVLKLTPTLQPQWVLPLQGVVSFKKESRPRLMLDATSGDVWVILPGSAMRLNRMTNQFVRLEGNYLMPKDSNRYPIEGRLFRDLAADVESVWLVGLESVFQYRKVDSSVMVWDTKVVPALREPRCVTVGETAVFVAADSGLLAYERRSGRWTAQPWPDELADEPATALSLDTFEPYYVWVATARHVARLELKTETPRWQVFPRRTGLVPGITKIVPTRTAVWFAGRGGVSQYRRSTAELGAVR